MNNKYILIAVLAPFVAIFTWGIVSVYSDTVQQETCENTLSHALSPINISVERKNEHEIGQPENLENSNISQAVHVMTTHSSYIDMLPNLLTPSPISSGSSNREYTIINTPKLEIIPDSQDISVTLDIVSSDANNTDSTEVSTGIETETPDTNSSPMSLSHIDNGENPLAFLAGWEAPNYESESDTNQIVPGVSNYQFPAYSQDGTFFYPSPGDYPMMQTAFNNGDQLFASNQEPAIEQETMEQDTAPIQDQSGQDTLGIEMPVRTQKQVQDQKSSTGRSGASNSSQLALYELLRRQHDQDSTISSSDDTREPSKATQKLLLNSMQKQQNKSAMAENNGNDPLLLDDPVIDDGDGDGIDDGDGVFDDPVNPINANSLNDLQDGDGHTPKPKEQSMFGKFKNIMKDAAGAGWRKFSTLWKADANKNDANSDPAQQVLNAAAQN